ncbi:MAG TPA: hypothetical protein VGC27_00385, partial [Rhizomicrobium sp.]
TDWNSLISANEVSIASAAACDLDAAGSLFVQITGNTTIASFGTGTNKLRFVRFAQALTLTHNAASLILLGAANRITAANDVGIYASDANGNWRERSYFVAAAAPGSGGGSGGTLASKAEAEAGTDNTAVMTPQRTSQAILANALGFRNIAGRNGGFEVWQRLGGTGGATFIAVPAGTTAYTCDGWYLKTGATQASAVSRIAGLTGGSRYAAQVQRSAVQTGTGAIYFAMPLDIDELKKAAGKALQFFFTVSTGANWSPANGTLTYNVYFGTGAAGKRNGAPYAGETNPVTGSVNLAQGASAAQVIAAISPAVAANVACAEIQFAWTPSGTAGANDWFAIDDVGLHAVPAGLPASAPAFERTEYVWDLQRCCVHYYRRYATVANETIGMMTAYTTTQLWGTVLQLPVSMRSTPNVAVSAPGDLGTFGAGSGTTAIASTNFSGSSAQTISSYNGIFAANAILTIGQAAILTFRTTTGWIEASAEI